MIRHEKISQGHAKILIGLENALLIAEKIIKKKLSVRQTENLVRLLKKAGKNKNNLKDTNITSTENELTNKIGMRVILNNKKNNSGSLTFQYKGLDQLDRLIKIVKNEIINKDQSVKGFNIGTNIGKDSGQSIFHCHIHLIPRRVGDVKNPQGGVRSVIPNKQHYKRQK